MKQAKKLYEFYIAGVQFHDLNKCIDGLKVSDELYLESEPTNQYDKNAVKIIASVYNEFNTKDDYTKYMIGYVPGKLSADITHLLKSKTYKTSCKISKLNPEAKAWNRIKVIIEITGLE